MNRTQHQTSFRSRVESLEDRTCPTCVVELAGITLTITGNAVERRPWKDYARDYRPLVELARDPSTFHAAWKGDCKRNSHESMCGGVWDRQFGVSTRSGRIASGVSDRLVNRYWFTTIYVIDA